MTESSDREHQAEIARRADFIQSVRDRCGAEVILALNGSVPFLTDVLRREGPVADLPYVPHDHQGNRCFTARSTDPEIVSARHRFTPSLARLLALHVPSLEEARQFHEDSRFLDHKGVALAKLPGAPPITRTPAPKLTRSMTETRFRELTIKAATGLVDPSRIVVTSLPGSLGKLRCLVAEFATGGGLVVPAAFEFQGLSIWSMAVALRHPEKPPLPLLLFNDVNPASDFAWPADMPGETRIACALRVIAAFAAQIPQTQEGG